MNVRIALVASAVAAGLTLSSCAAGEPAADESPSAAPTTASSSASPTASPTEASADVTLTLEGGSWSGAGRTIEAKRDEPVVLEIISDVAGELHVHSTPEQQVAYGVGTSTHTLTFERPGVIEIESHEPNAVVVQVEVR